MSETYAPYSWSATAMVFSHAGHVCDATSNVGSSWTCALFEDADPAAVPLAALHPLAPPNHDAPALGGVGQALAAFRSATWMPAARRSPLGASGSLNIAGRGLERRGGDCWGRTRGCGKHALGIRDLPGRRFGSGRNCCERSRPTRHPFAPRPSRRLLRRSKLAQARRESTWWRGRIRVRGPRSPRSSSRLASRITRSRSSTR